MALWLHGRLAQVRQHEAAGDIHREVSGAVERGWQAVNRPAQRVYAGPCDQCGMDLVTQAGRTLVTCAMCHATYGIAERQEWMRAQLHDYLVTATEAADEWLPAIGIRVADGTIRMWASRHRLEKWPGIPRWPGDEDAPPRYRVGDIAALALARDATRTGLRVLRLRLWPAVAMIRPILGQRWGDHVRLERERRHQPPGHRHRMGHPTYPARTAVDDQTDHTIKAGDR
jgi:hypothetical protein